MSSKTLEQEKNEKMNNKTRIMFNNLEAGFKDDFNIEYEKEPEYIFFIENCRRKERKNLDKDLIRTVKKDINFWKAKYTKSKIIHLFQFKKGLLKTKEQIKITMDCQAVENSDGICFYEESIAQDSNEFKKQILEFLKFKPEIVKYAVLEIEAEDLAEKLATALNNGLNNFILIGGDYENNDLWITITSSIREAGGKSIMLLPARMHKTTKESYIKKALLFRFDYVVHGMPYGGQGKKKDRTILFLDKTDLIYRELKEIKDDELKKLVAEKCSGKQEQYELSRVLAVDVADTFAETYEPAKVIKT